MKLEPDQQFTVYLTPLTPVHIGCAVDYEPTDTLIHNKQLYHLKGLADWQGAGREALAKELTSAQTFQQIQAAFTKIAAELKALATRPTPMPFDAVWNSDKRGKIKTIERTAFNAFSATPIVTGSALKGAFRNAYIESNRLQGSFDSDPLRQLKISDSSIQSQALTAIFQRQSRHRDMTKTSVEDASQNYAESILAGQKEAFECVVSKQSLDGKASLKELDLTELISLVCQHTFTTIQTEMNTQRGNADNLPLKVWWLKHNAKLQMLKNKGAALIRIGKHVGAEQLTDGRERRIKTKYNTPAPISTTLAFDGKNNYPFGFMLLVPDYARADCEPLLNELLAAMPNELATLKAAQAMQETHLTEIATIKAKWVADESYRIQKAKDEEVERAAQAAKEQAELERKAKQSPQQNAIEDLIAKAQEKAAVLKGKKLSKSDESYSWFNDLLKKAATEGWSEADKSTLAQAITQHLPTIISGFLQTDKDGRKALKKLLEPLNLPAA